jgi:hypothetical protein
MTQEEILAMPPGIELNMKVAEEVIGYVISKDNTFGYMKRTLYPETKNPACGCCSPKEGDSVWGLVQPFSEDISAAELVVDRMIEIGYDD